jgi:hypothetical protein
MMTTATTIGPDGQYEPRERQQATPKRQLIRTADELVKALDVEPQRVAFALFRINRFGGQVYGCEVLGHSLRVYEALPSVSSYAARMWALLHDAHEIITGDLVRPYKSVRLSRGQSEIDAVLQARFCPSITGDDIEMVRAADVAVGDGELRRWENQTLSTLRRIKKVEEWCGLFRRLQTS